jgi:hypothetical protein
MADEENIKSLPHKKATAIAFNRNATEVKNIVIKYA